MKGLNPFLVAVLSFAGNFLTVFLLIVLFERFKLWRRKKKGPEEKESGRSKRGKKIWNRYGLPGLALAGPILIGTHIAAAIGMGLGAKKQWTTIWMTISLVLWSGIFTIATHYGFELFKG
ncbi:small multi-drug export protein [Cytobacillus oceanisediminis]|uniref:small multi-drug export protein n=1 Tax=Cytobacillus oceanisediminis TaxID=665099 RepID=UPI0033862010